MPIEDKRRRADRLVDNGETLEHTRRQVERLIEDLKETARSTKTVSRRK
jgi:dephospho-CoA kinase